MQNYTERLSNTWCNHSLLAQELEAYYTSAQWREDFANDEKGMLPEK